MNNFILIGKFFVGLVLLFAIGYIIGYLLKIDTNTRRKKWSPKTLKNIEKH